MIKAREDLLFDDRKLILIGAPVLAIFYHLVLMGRTTDDYITNFPQEFLEGLAYTVPIWLIFREIIIRLRARYGTGGSFRKEIKVIVIVVLVVAPIIQTFVTVMLSLIRQATGLKQLFEPGFWHSTFATYFVVLGVVFLYESIYFFQKYKRELMEKEQIKQMHVQSQLDNLRNQINPHFLFNSLNTLMNLISSDSDRAMSFLDKLSKFYRYSVSSRDDQLVRLGTELLNLRVYADLLHERFRGGLFITIPQYYPHEALVVPLCMQLLVENAVKHNVVSAKKPLKIEVRMDEAGRYIMVTNNIQEKIQEVASTGMGLGNIRERVSLTTSQEVIVEDGPEQFRVSIPLVYSFDNVPKET